MWAGTALLAWSQTSTERGAAPPASIREKGGGSSGPRRVASNQGAGGMAAS